MWIFYNVLSNIFCWCTVKSFVFNLLFSCCVVFFSHYKLRCYKHSCTCLSLIECLYGVCLEWDCWIIGYLVQQAFLHVSHISDSKHTSMAKLEAKVSSFMCLHTWGVSSFKQGGQEEPRGNQLARSHVGIRGRGRCTSLILLDNNSSWGCRSC